MAREHTVCQAFAINLKPDSKNSAIMVSTINHHGTNQFHHA